MDNNNNEKNISQTEIGTPFEFLQERNSNVYDIDDPGVNSGKEPIEISTGEKPEDINDTSEPKEGLETSLEPKEEEGKAPDAKEGLDDEPKEKVDTGENKGEEEYDVKVEGNIAKYAAEVLKASGGLPDDFEITDDIEEKDIDIAYVKYKEEVLRSQIANEEKQKLIEEEGLTPKMIEEVKLKHFGVQDEKLKQLQTLDYMTSYNFDEKSESFEDDAKNFLASYYSLKRINPSRIESLVNNDLNDENVYSIIVDAQKDLRDDLINLEVEIKEKVDTEKLQRTKLKEENIQKANSFLKTDGFGGRSLMELEEARKALFDKTEIITGPDGTRYRTTLYYKRKMEAAKDLEKDLLDKINFVLGSNTSVIKNEERQKTTKKLLNSLNKFVDVKVKPSKKSKPNVPNKEQNIERVEIN